LLSNSAPNPDAQSEDAQALRSAFNMAHKFNQNKDLFVDIRLAKTTVERVK
jgi:hypothetical protein